VSDRDVSRLDPLPTAGVPGELLPLIQQINALLLRLDISLDAQRRFLADAAHELRSPVSALALQAQLAQRAQTPQARESALEELRLGTERTRRLVQQLLDFARLEPGVPSGPLLPVDLARIARDVVGAHASVADERGVDLGAETSGPAYVSGIEAERAMTRDRHGFNTAMARRAARMLAPAAIRNTLSQLPLVFWRVLAYGTSSAAVPLAV